MVLGACGGECRYRGGVNDASGNVGIVALGWW